ncbi:MAG: DNA recombination protein RmuC [Prevotellaceae bacterium]|nr:DNA recombination protein RmuC [Prevotellaceae bacterium]
MTLVYIIAGIAVGALGLYVLMSSRISRLTVDREKGLTELELKAEQIAQVTAQFGALETENKQLTEENKRLNATEQALRREIEMLNQHRLEDIANRDKVFGEQMRSVREQFEEQLKTSKEQIQNMTRQLLEVQAQRLKEENTENMNSITQPLKDAIGEMRKAISDSSKDHTDQSATLREQLRILVESNAKIGEKAESLANVLRRDNKVSGNMGEIILGDLLASQGLTEGLHYEVQARLRDELGRPLKNDDTGKEMQPDVILHYPQGQDAVIDSKVSLVAYQRYVNAETPEEKDKALQEHIKSIRSHVGELARKDYSKYIKSPREAVDFVIMFVPFESSLQLALANDPTLWRDAFERKVFIAGEQNLMGILHIISVAWVQNQQAENQERVFGIAEQLLDRLGDFIQRYNKVGEQLEQARKAFDFANNKLIVGRQSVVQKGRELIDLGGKENPNRRIPKAEQALGVGEEEQEPKDKNI